MAGHIPPAFIDDLLVRTDIVELISSRVPLRKAGKDFQSRCPFHDEKTPSFTVSPEKQFYHCFGCGAHGTAIGFLMEFDRLEFREAIEELAQRAGLEIPGDDAATPVGPDPGPLLEMLAAANTLYQRQLREHPASAAARDYLQARGLSQEIVQRYGLGFAPPGWRFLLQQLGTESWRQGQLLDAGLLAKNDSGQLYDRLRERITFPIHDRRGRVIGFGGRLLGDGKPKYLNSPETPLFHKSRELYGLFEAQAANRVLERVLVVEGYLDVITLAQFGLNATVATLGTATTFEHLQRLARLAPEVVFCFDGDRAGREAAWKALQTALPQATGKQSLRFLFLPQGEDPDTLIRKEGLDGFEARLAEALPLSRLLFDQLSAALDMSSLDDRARLVTLAEPLIAQVPEGAYRALLQQRLAELTGVTYRTTRARGFSAPPKRRSAAPDGGRPSLIAQAIALVLDQPALAVHIEEIADDWRRASTPGAGVLAQLIEQIQAHPSITKGGLLEQWRDHPHFAYLQRLSVASFLRDLPDETVAAAHLIGALRRLNDEVRRHELTRALSHASVSELNDDTRTRIGQLTRNARNR